MARKKLRWEHWAIIALVAALIAAWVMWPKPKVDERVKVFQSIIDDQQVVIDSLISELAATQSGMDRLTKIRDNEREASQKEIARLKNQRQENESIDQLPTPELDSLVRMLYGAGAI